MTAAPVVTTGAHLDATGGRAAAVVLNSGNANAATGTPGRIARRADVRRGRRGAGLRADEVLVCSTGLIGFPLPIAADPGRHRGAGGRPAAPTVASDAAEAIRTTDTHRKEADGHGGGFIVGGMAKGAAMLAPNMATMLAVLTTDAAVDQPDAAPRTCRPGWPTASTAWSSTAARPPTTP